MRQRFARLLVLVVMLAGAMSVAADADVTFDFQTNRGFVERPAVQMAFGLNNGQMQKRAAQVVFSAVETHTVAVNCASGAVGESVMEIIAILDFTIVPTKGSFEGFALAGVRAILIADPPPVEGICGGPGSLGTQVAVVRSLRASLGGQSETLIEEH